MAPSSTRFAGTSMAKHQPDSHPDQTFLDTERLFRRVLRKDMKPNGKARFLAFELPDMSVNRERFSTAEEARRGFRVEDWGVVSFLVRDIPPRVVLDQASHSYTFRPRHVPEPGNFAHAEARVWRVDGADAVLVTRRTENEFLADDPDRLHPRIDPDDPDPPVTALDPDFHMRWRKQIEWKCQPELRPEGDEGSVGAEA